MCPFLNIYFNRAEKILRDLGAIIKTLLYLYVRILGSEDHPNQKI